MRSVDVVNYRKFRNADPPLIAGAWNDIFTARGAALLEGTGLFDHFILAKTYFDPAGLILAEENGVCVGFVHAGLSICKTTGHELPHGVVCILGVRPERRKQGIGSELLKRAEAYLGQRGAVTISAGDVGAANPFFLGLYGGSDSPGVLLSDSDAGAFFAKHRYRLDRQILVMQRDLTAPLRVVDPRFAGLRQRYEIFVRSPRALGDLAMECSLGQTEPLEFFLKDRASGAAAARTYAWEMEGFSYRWRRPAVGLVGFQVEPALRRQGLGKYLAVNLLRQLQEQFCDIVETHLDDKDPSSQAFARGLGFQQVDTGQVFVRNPG